MGGSLADRPSPVFSQQGTAHRGSPLSRRCPPWTVAPWRCGTPSTRGTGSTSIQCAGPPRSVAVPANCLGRGSRTIPRSSGHAASRPSAPRSRGRPKGEVRCSGLALQSMQASEDLLAPACQSDTGGLPRSSAAELTRRLASFSQPRSPILLHATGTRIGQASPFRGAAQSPERTPGAATVSNPGSSESHETARALLRLWCPYPAERLARTAGESPVAAGRQVSGTDARCIHSMSTGLGAPRGRY